MRITILLSVLVLAGCNTNPAISNYDPEFDVNDDDTAAEQEYVERLDVQACYDISDRDKERPLTLANIYESELENFGFVMLADGKTHTALHFYKGLNKTWSFGCDDDMTRCDYQVVLKPSGDMHYYDFSNTDVGESVTSSFWMKCEYDADYAYEINQDMEHFYDETKAMVMGLQKDVKAIDADYKI